MEADDWGQIAQQVQVESGKEHALRFSVHSSNYCKSTGLLFEVLIDDKVVWRVNSRHRVKWIAGEVFFVADR